MGTHSALTHLFAEWQMTPGELARPATAVAGRFSPWWKLKLIGFSEIRAGIKK
jgi:hypothetical protein